MLFLGAFFCYGMYTIQRPGFFLENMRIIWKKFPKGLHEPLFSCGVCVSSFWGMVFLALKYLHLDIIIYLVAFAGVCALLDRAVKFFEYGYKYNPVPSVSNYSYLEKATFRDTLINGFVNDAIDDGYKIVEIGGYTKELDILGTYIHYELPNNDFLKSYQESNYFVIIKGIAFQGNFDVLLSFLSSPGCKGFVIEGSTSGSSKSQIQWILDKFEKEVIQMPYKASISATNPSHCGLTVNNRIVIVKPIS